MPANESNLCVTASGPALSYLLYENTKSSGRQIGFLLGAVVHQVMDNITDSHMQGEKTETIITVSSILPVHYSSICNSSGNILKEAVHELLTHEKALQGASNGPSNDIVGWYSFKRGTSNHISLFERTMHCQLSEMAQDLAKGMSSDLFIMCVLSSSLSNTKATHMYKHSFMRYLDHRKSFEVVPLQIHNLGVSQQLQYQLSVTTPSNETLLKRLVEYVGQKPTSKDFMLEAQKALQTKLMNDVRELVKIEEKRLVLQQEVDRMRQMAEALKNQCSQEKMQIGEEEGNGTRHIDNRNSRKQMARQEDSQELQQERLCNLFENYMHMKTETKTEASAGIGSTSPVLSNNTLTQRRPRQQRQDSPDVAASYVVKKSYV